MDPFYFFLFIRLVGEEISSVLMLGVGPVAKTGLAMSKSHTSVGILTALY